MAEAISNALPDRKTIIACAPVLHGTKTRVADDEQNGLLYRTMRQVLNIVVVVVMLVAGLFSVTGTTAVANHQVLLSPHHDSVDSIRLSSVAPSGQCSSMTCASMNVVSSGSAKLRIRKDDSSIVIWPGPDTVPSGFDVVPASPPPRKTV